MSVVGSWLKVYGHRVVGVLVCVLVVGGVVAGGVWSWCVAQRRRVARENAYVASEMIREFVGVVMLRRGFRLSRILPGGLGILFLLIRWRG